MRYVTKSGSIRFGAFRLNLATGELYQQDEQLHLQEQPLQLLEMLVTQPGELLTREHIRHRLWPNGTIVEFDHSINTAIKKLRVALKDPAEKPCYIETVARRGYRLMVPAEWAEERSPDPALYAAQRLEPELSIANQTGKRISHYRVLEVLGGGGMGVVYAAEDLKLGRRVALKFLPQEVRDDPRALERFECEARAASAREHPNICSVYELGEHDGQPFIAMHLLEGQTLRQRIAREGPLPLEELLDFATQICAGLQAAHEKGIVHRDIKPANIFLTDRKEAKILDFGLAQLQGPEILGQESCEGTPAREVGSPMATENTGFTVTGVTLGTAAYMSPEQVRGEKLDARTDLFSFGLVLYEMATGRQAFAGETAAVLREAILSRTPVPVCRLNPEIPVTLEKIIGKALEKDRELRYQTAPDLRDALHTLRAGSLIADREGPASLLGALQIFSRRQAVVIAAIVLLIVLIGAALRIAQKQPFSLLDLKQRQLTANSSENAVPGGAISPNGKYLAYADLKGIHIKLIETGETRTVPQPDELKGLQVNWGIISTWCCDGATFLANAGAPGQRSSIWAISPQGAPPRKVRDGGYAWSVSRDGSWVAFNANPGRVFYHEMWVMRPDGTQARKLYEAGDNSGFQGAEWSPDGQRLSYAWHHQVADKIEESIESRDLKGGPATTAIKGFVWDWTWSPDGRMIYSLPEQGAFGESCNFWAVRIDPHTGKPSEKPRRLTNWAGFCMDNPSVSADGKRLAFRKWSAQASVYIAEFEAGETGIASPRRLTMNEGRNYPAAWTADSKALVFGSYLDDHWRIFKQSVDADEAEPIATTEEVDGTPARVSPDGAWVLYLTRSKNSGSSSIPAAKRLMRIPLRGGHPELVLTANIYDRPACSRSPAMVCALAEQTPDHKQLIFTAFDPVRGLGHELIRFNTEPARGIQYVWDLSPDGARIAILRYSEARIHILDLAGRAPQDIAVKGWKSFQSVNWAADGKGLLASSATQAGSALLHMDLQGKTRILWTQKGSIEPWLGHEGLWLGGPPAPWAVPSPDGHLLAIYQWILSGNIWMIEDF